MFRGLESLCKSNYKKNKSCQILPVIETPRRARDSEPEVTEWTPDIPSLMMGFVVGTFVVMVGFKVAEYREAQAAAIEAPVAETVEERSFKLDFMRP